jgi:hypothetical protein
LLQRVFLTVWKRCPNVTKKGIDQPESDIHMYILVPCNTIIVTGKTWNPSQTGLPTPRAVKLLQNHMAGMLKWCVTFLTGV